MNGTHKIHVEVPADEAQAARIEALAATIEEYTQGRVEVRDCLVFVTDDERLAKHLEGLLLLDDGRGKKKDGKKPVSKKALATGASEPEKLVAELTAPVSRVMCAECGGPMVGKRSTARFCSRECQIKHNRAAEATKATAAKQTFTWLVLSGAMSGKTFNHPGAALKRGRLQAGDKLRKKDGQVYRVNAQGNDLEQVQA